MVNIDMAIQRLVEARKLGTPAHAVHLLDTGAAYAVQQGVADALGWFGSAVPAYWKSGGASRGAALTHAPLPPAGVWRSPAVAGGTVFRLRGIEAEVALRLGEPVTPERAAALEPATARALVDAMTVSIEVVESRWVEGFDAPPLARLADLQSHGALVLGSWVPFDAARDWSTQVCRVRIGAQPVREFRGTHSLADPAWVLPGWLRHASREGAVVPAGTVVTTGTWCGLLRAAAGDVVEVVFDGIGEARLAF